MNMQRRFDLDDDYGLTLFRNSSLNTFGGRVFKFNTTSNHRVITDNNVDIINSHFLRFSVHACYDQLLRLGSVGHLASNSYFLEIVLTHSYIGIRDNCGPCVATNVKYLNTFNCSNTFKFWLSWPEEGVVDIGTDYGINQNVVTRYQSNIPFKIDFITLRSYYKTGYWTIIKDDPPDVLCPDPKGLTTVYLNETMPLDSPILDVAVTDPENDSISIALLTHTELFDVDNGSLNLKGKLDFETTATYDISLNITDGLNIVYVSLTVIILDVIDEPPNIYVRENFQLVEELDLGTELRGLYNVTDGDILEFFLEGEDSDKFDMDINNGTIIVKDRIDREALNSYDQLGPLVIKVVDSAGLTRQASFNITVTDINDNPPVCVASPESVTVYEDHYSETPIANISCIDEDLEINTHITFSVVSPQYFISVIRFENNTLVVEEGAFDLEILKQNNISLIIQINDTQNPVHNNSVYRTLMIKIISVNEYEPTFVSNTNISHKVITMWNIIQPGQLVYTVYAQDEDWGTDGIITYIIANISFDSNTSMKHLGLIEDLFSINSITGDININRILVDYTNISYYLTVEARDGALLARSSFLEISFVIKDASSYWPIIETELFTVNLSCYQLLDVSMFRVGTSNPEVTVPIVYSIEQNKEEQFLVINETTGDVILVHRPETFPLLIVSKLCVANPLAPTKFSCGFLILEFPSCASESLPSNSTTDQPNKTNGATSTSSFGAFMDALQKIILMVLCGVETLVLFCIGIVYLLKVKKCRTSNVHPRQDIEPRRQSSRAKTVSCMSAAKSQARTVSTRCSSIESLSLV